MISKFSNGNSNVCSESDEGSSDSGGKDGGAMRIRIEPGVKTLEKVMRGSQLNSEGVTMAATATM